MTPTSLIDRNIKRVRNGVKYALGLDQPRVGQTPKDTVWSRDKVELWRYRNDDVKSRTPVLVVHSLVSKSFVLDLQPGNSFIEWMRNAGFDIFLTDWGEPDEREAANTLETYVDGYLPEMIEQTRRVAGTDDVTVLGYCFGGVMSLLSLARHPELPVRNLVTMATPVDYRHMGLFTTFLADERIAADQVLDDSGNVAPELLRQSFRLLKPTGDLSTYANLWQFLPDDEYMRGFRAMGRWTREHIPFPGGVFRQTKEAFGTENAIMNGTMRLGGERVDLKRITCPVLNVLAERDHIVPEPAARPVLDLVGSKQKEELRLKSGHVALVAGRRAAVETIPHIAEWLAAHSEPVAGASSGNGKRGGRTRAGASSTGG